ncbi:MAG: biopolymer transporter ExbD [Opitutus sp.]
MITRPLDLASKLRPEPRSFDFLFYVNAGLIALVFVLSGSRFILTPGLGVDFKMPKLRGAVEGAIPTDNFISVLPSGQIFADGLLNMSQLRDWLRVEAKKSRQPSLLVRASAGVPLSQLTEIFSAAREAGFTRVVWGAEEPPAEKSQIISR